MAIRKPDWGTVATLIRQHMVQASENSHALEMGRNPPYPPASVRNFQLVFNSLVGVMIPGRFSGIPLPKYPALFFGVPRIPALSITLGLYDIFTAASVTALQTALNTPAMGFKMDVDGIAGKQTFEAMDLLL